MNPRELVDHIRSGPAKLVLDEPLRFRRRTRSNPCDFNEFLQALRSSDTIRTVDCGSQLNLGISEHEWVLLLKTLGSIRDIQNLEFNCRPGSRDFHPFQAVVDAVNNAHTLSVLFIGLKGATFPRFPSGLTALANAFRKHTGLQNFTLLDQRSLPEGTQSTVFDPVLQALSACAHLQNVFLMTQFASADAIRNLLQLPTDIKLTLALTLDQWVVVADEIRLGRCLIKQLHLLLGHSSSSKATEAVKLVASAIQEDRHLEYLRLGMEDGFTDEAGVALAEALTINTTLHVLGLDDDFFPSDPVHTKADLGAQAYEAFGAMLRVNTSIDLHLPAFDATFGAIKPFHQMHIEKRLNEVGRGRLLASIQTPREEWIIALQELNAPGDDLFEVGCRYSLLRLNPSVCLLEPNHTTNSGT
jgi:hypothetical protein